MQWDEKYGGKAEYVNHSHFQAAYGYAIELQAAALPWIAIRDNVTATDENIKDHKKKSILPS